MGGLRSAHPALAATVSGCPTTEAALSADITAAGAGGTVAFTCVTATTISFTSQITISQTVTLDASGATGAVSFDGGNSHRLFSVNSGAGLTLTHLTLQHGNASLGGAIFNQ